MPTSDDLREQLGGQVRVLQIIVAAVALGPVIYLSVAVSMAPQAAKAGGISVTYLACGAAVAAVAARLFVPAITVRSQRRQMAAGLWSPPSQAGNSLAAPMTDMAKLAAVYSVRTIVAVALLEGAAFFLVMAYQLERDPVALVAAVLLIIVIAAHLPTRARASEWVERQLQQLDEDRQLEHFRR